jgi:hypothetical protein
MPLRLTVCLCAAITLLSLATTGQSAPLASGRWQAVLAAGDVAEPVFDNAVAAFSQWLTARGVAAGDIRRMSANPARAEATAEPASAGQLLRRIALLPARQGDRCLVFVTSHGEHNRGVFLAYAHELLTPAALRADTFTVDNKGDALVLFVEGQELRGAKQNRVLNTSIMIEQHSQVPIPVSCVEQGRWSYRSRNFGSHGTSSHSVLRQKMTKSVSRSYEACAAPR